MKIKLLIILVGAGAVVVGISAVKFSQDIAPTPVSDASPTLPSAQETPAPKEQPTVSLSTNTNIFLNGQELTIEQVAEFERVLGHIAPGSYWIRVNGDFGREGNPTPLGNWYAITQGSTEGGDVRGDNFWSEGNFGAGNYNEDNSQGYVSVPGYGPVDYGF